MLTEPQAERLYDRAFRAWLQEALQRSARRRAPRAAADQRAASFGGGDDGPIDRLRSAGRALAEWRDFPAPWRRPPFDRAREIDRLVDGAARLADLTARGVVRRATTCSSTPTRVRRLSRQIRLEQSFGRRDLDGWEARLVDLVRDRGFSRTRKGSGYKYGKRRDAHRGARPRATRSSPSCSSSAATPTPISRPCLQQELRRRDGAVPGS